MLDLVHPATALPFMLLWLDTAAEEEACNSGPRGQTADYSRVDTRRSWYQSVNF